MTEPYRHPGYVASLGAWGRPRALPRSRGWVVERPIPGSKYRDASGPYPIFACADWSLLATDLADLPENLVSVVVVTDPFAEVREPLLRTAFPDLVRPFRRHYVVDLAQDLESIGTRKQRKVARRGTRALEIEHVADPAGHADTWTSLYSHLVARHQVTGVRTFSHEAFAAVLAIPGASLLLARHRGRVVAGQLYLRGEAVVHCHLGASTAEGYSLGASYALDQRSFEVFRPVARWLDLGGGIGADDGTDGLANYKARWASTTLWTWLCGRVLNRRVYQELVAARETSLDGWFPAYRTDEPY